MQADPSFTLPERLRRRIAASGPIGVDAYMEACLSDPEAGYYRSRLPFGAAGDFVTAPEISQIFGELLGAWAVSVWESMGHPSPLTLIEIGPGRGTLIADALRVWQRAPEFLSAISIALVETSPALRDLQAAAVAGAALPVTWYDAIEDVPQAPAILLANEFIDALPVRQLVHAETGWHERVVALDPNGAFIFAEGPMAGEPLPEWASGAGNGAVLERRPIATAFLEELGRRGQDSPLVALLIDFGYEEPGFGDTLQAVRSHVSADPLLRPGEADIAAQVDFAALIHTARQHGLHPYGPMPQGEFLLRLGLPQRRERLLAAASTEQEVTIASSTARLIDPAQMGVLFKVLALTSGGLPPPPPFAASV